MLGVGAGYDIDRPLTLSEIERLSHVGAGFVGRYYSVPKAVKNLTPTEAKVISHYGMAIVSIFETRGQPLSYFTAAQGSTDARLALQCAEIAGQNGGHIFSAVDFVATETDLPAIKKYLAAFATILSRQNMHAGVYGSPVLGSLNYPLFQTFAGANNVVHPKARILQFGLSTSTQSLYADGDIGPVDYDFAAKPLGDLGWHINV